MPKIKYIEKKFSETSLANIAQAEKVIDGYRDAGLELTLRQLYYQFVARDIIPEDRRWTWTGKRWKRDLSGTKNAFPNYKWLGSLINDGRLAGLIDWHAIIDLSRSLLSTPHWNSPADIIQAAVRSYAIDKWQKQQVRCEVWIEKDALIGVIGRPCNALDVPYFSCRGYTGQSAMWDAALRMRRTNEKHNCKTVVFHFGDHDPSGVDMTRDIQERLIMLSGNADIKIKRVALNMNQITKYKPPPNPAKITDSRTCKYIKKYGIDSWELDALEPALLNDLVTKNILSILDKKKYDSYKRKEERERLKINKIAESM